MLDAAATLDPTGPEPLWRQVARLIDAEVQGGVLAAGSRLPAERDLCHRLGISRVTLRKALAHLVDEGVLESSRGRGWYVTTGVLGEPPNLLRSFTRTADARGLQAGARVLAHRTRPATLDEAELLQIAPGAPLFELERVRLLGGSPIATDTARVALGRAPGIDEPDYARASLYAELERRGIVPTRADYAVQALPATAREAALLDIGTGRPVLVTSQTTFDQHDRPVELATMAYRGDRYRFRASLRRPATTTPPRRVT